MTILFSVLPAIALFLFILGLASFAAMLKGCLVLRRMARETPGLDLAVLLKSPLVPAVSVIAAPPDASDESRDFVRRLLSLEFGNLEVVVALDGRSETELSNWIQEFHLFRSAAAGGAYESRDPLRLVLLDARPAVALNACVSAASAPIVALIDPECEFEPTLLLNLIRPMLEDPERTVAVCGLMPPPPGPAGFSRAFRRHRISAVLARARRRLRRMGYTAAGSRGLHAGEPRRHSQCGRVPRRSARAVSRPACARARERKLPDRVRAGVRQLCPSSAFVGGPVEADRQRPGANRARARGGQGPPESGPSVGACPPWSCSAGFGRYWKASPWQPWPRVG